MLSVIMLDVIMLSVTALLPQPLLLTVRLNQLPFSADMWQHGSQKCFANFI